jgi:ABC-type bacteriocin/lantibiotic exporter with double-glycine peptidase domain
MEKLITSLETAYDVLTAVEKIGQVTDLELENEKENNQNFISNNQALKVEFKNVFYHYENNISTILNDINYTINPKEKICISGFSSSGKSTLISLLSGVSTPSKGNIFINNQNLKDIYPPEYHDLMGHAFQLDKVFSGTILENVSLNKENVSFNDVMWAIEKVGLKEMVKTLPDGYNTHISTNYNQFSRNTIQKIILARAIVTKPKLLLLEYAFEYFGLKTKKDLIDFICENDNPWTVVAASNDPTIAQACDKVIILKDGVVSYQGKFEDLIKIPEIQNLYNA